VRLETALRLRSPSRVRIRLGGHRCFGSGIRKVHVVFAALARVDRPVRTSICTAFVRRSIVLLVIIAVVVFSLVVVVT